MIISKSDGTEIGETPGVWLDLKNVKKLYVRARGTPTRNINRPWSDNPSLVTSYASDPNGHPFTRPLLVRKEPC